MPAERLYYADSALTYFTATVTDIRERSRTGGESLWQVALDRSAFYPTTGGQPHDTGALIATAPSGARLEAPVIEVEEDEHGEVWHVTRKPLLAGTAVEGVVDWRRRLDHMQQHSGQHLLSALFYQELRALTVSFHLGDAVSTIDLNTESVEPAQLAHIEQLANAIVAEARPVIHRSVGTADAELLLQAGALRKLPARQGEIRLIVITGKGAGADAAVVYGEGAPNPDLDVIACGGTHVTSTSQIGPVLLRGTERIRQSVRVSFLCGNRAIAAARADDTLLTQLSREISAGRADLPAALGRLKGEAKTSAKERQALREELANYHAARLIVEDPPQNDLRIVRRIFSDRDAEYIKLLGSRVVSAAPHTIALLASTQQQHAPAAVVMALSQELGQNAGEVLRSALAASGGRGGGSATLAQGLVAVDQLGNVLDTLETQLRSRPIPAS
jgi:alanyl-tRNA synthetase